MANKLANKCQLAVVPIQATLSEMSNVGSKSKKIIQIYDEGINIVYDLKILFNGIIM
jgi:hypothetical protein